MVKLTEIMTRIDKLEKHLTPTETTPVPDLNEILASILSRLDNIEKRLSPHSTQAPLANPESDHEKQRSLVLSGLPETTGLPSQQKLADLSSVNEIFDEIDVYAAVAHVYRLGKPRDDKKPRKLKIVLAASAQKWQAIKNARKLAQSVKYKRIFIRPSMSPEERNEDLKLRRELYEMRQSGQKARIKGSFGGPRFIEVIQGKN